LRRRVASCSWRTDRCGRGPARVPVRGRHVPPRRPVFASACHSPERKVGHPWAPLWAPCGSAGTSLVAGTKRAGKEEQEWAHPAERQRPGPGLGAEPRKKWDARPTRPEKPMAHDRRKGAAWIYTTSAVCSWPPGEIPRGKVRLAVRGGHDGPWKLGSAPGPRRAQRQDWALGGVQLCSALLSPLGGDFSA